MKPEGIYDDFDSNMIQRNVTHLRGITLVKKAENQPRTSSALTHFMPSVLLCHNSLDTCISDSEVPG